MGAKKASGKYIYFFDSDVYPDPDFIQTTLAELKRRKLSKHTKKGHKSMCPPIDGSIILIL